AMEDCLVAAQADPAVLTPSRIDTLLRGGDLLSRIAQNAPSAESGRVAVGDADIEAFLHDLAAQADLEASPSSAAGAAPSAASAEAHPIPPDAASSAQRTETAEPVKTEDADRVLRVGADHLTRLLGLAGEAVVASRWLEGFTTDLFRLKRIHGDL